MGNNKGRAWNVGTKLQHRKSNKFATVKSIDSFLVTIQYQDGYTSTVNDASIERYFKIL